jgi:hypothetical protein
MAILINPIDRTVTEVEFDGSLDQAYNLTDCNMIETFALPHGTVMLLDEDGLIKGGQYPWKLRGISTIFVGKTLLVGQRSWKSPPKLTLDEVQKMVMWPQQVG